LSVTRPFDAWVLYDGTCGFCSRWVPFWSRLLESHRIGIAPLQEPWVRQRVGNPTEAWTDDLRVLEAGGRIHSGADAYRYALRRIPWAWPFELAARVPVGRRIFDAAYRAIARNRYRISRACGLTPALTAAGTRPGRTPCPRTPD
jgi:predicted DCC family thiol-disulfide oxidoreductase YuxK